MNCPYCSAKEDKVVDTRFSDGGRVIRRRRKCLTCGKRFTTYERVEPAGRLVVVKRDGTRVPFEPENILRGVMAACGKRAIPDEAKRKLVEDVEEDLHREFDREVSSQIIGERVMQRLRELDEVAYIRFASEYYPHTTARDIARQIEELEHWPRYGKDQPTLFVTLGAETHNQTTGHGKEGTD